MAKENFDWAHFMALGLLSRDKSRVTDKELETMHPEVRGAVLDLTQRGFARWDESVACTMQGYSLTDEGAKYLEAAQVFLSTYQIGTTERQD